MSTVIWGTDVESEFAKTLPVNPDYVEPFGPPVAETLPLWQQPTPQSRAFFTPIKSGYCPHPGLHLYEAIAGDHTFAGKERYHLRCVRCQHRRHAATKEMDRLFAAGQLSGTERSQPPVAAAADERGDKRPSLNKFPPKKLRAQRGR